jgi:hypothetical protein
MVLVRQNRSVKRTSTKEDIVVGTFSNTEDPDDYNKKLEEIQAKYKCALNIQDEDKDQNIKKNKDSKRSAKELPFSLDEFNDFKKQIGGHKSEKIAKKVDAHVSKKSTK